jgi:hypothetical protein
MKAKISTSKGVQRITLVEQRGLRSNYFDNDLLEIIEVKLDTSSLLVQFLRKSEHVV